MTTKELYERYLKHRNITTDTRAITEGAMFFALRGDNFDGNLFVEQAFEKGASFCVVDNPKSVINEQCLLVDDVLGALQALAEYHRKKQTIPFLAITGTNGKTTTKELVHTVLSKKYRCHATKGNLNNHIGVPLTLLSMPENTEIAIIEMGANHQGEIDFLCKIAQPDFGIITNIGKAHLEGFGGFEGVVKTKTELYQYIKNKEGKLFVNADNVLLMEKSEGISRITYGTALNADYKATFKSANPNLSFYFERNDLVYNVQTQLLGGYNFENAVTATCIGSYFKVDDFDIKAALESYVSTNNRSQYIKTERNELYLDAYNANPSSMRVAIENFAQQENQYAKVLILGGMKELGKSSAEEHQGLVELIKSKNINRVFLVGEEFAFAKTENGIVWSENTEMLKKYLTENPLTRFFVLIKGSRSNCMETLVEML